MLIEVKVKITRNIDSKYRKTTETFILDREFFSHAEYCITHLLEADMEVHGGQIFDFEIQSLKWSNIKEIDDQTIDENKPSFIATLKDLFVDDAGNEKQLKYKVLLWAEDLTHANQRAHELSHQGYDMLVEGIKQVDYKYISSVEEENESEETE